MGHGKSDRLYVTPAEHSGVYGQHGASTGKHVTQEGDNYQPLPYDCCAISLQPWTNPVCSKEDGTIFELTNAIPFVKKYGVNPSTGTPMSLSDLIKLNFAKNERGKFHDPVSFKEFGEHTHIVAVANTGNVYAYETVQQLNIKAKFMRDLLSDEPFTKKDLITLQDPHNAQQKDVSKLHHVKNQLAVTEADRGIDTTEQVNLAATGSAGALLAKLREQEKKKTSSGSSPAASPSSSSTKPQPATDADSAYQRTKGKQTYNTTSLSTGATAASYTSSALIPQTKTERIVVDEEEFMFEQIKAGKGKEKGYVHLSTNFGPLNLELHCDKAPKTCYNFITLCKQGKYDDTIFHRNIPGFMIQGGDPTGTGRGGESIWGIPFRDEFNEPGAYRHTERGVLSMANKGASTNGSQFFFTYRATPHLDQKHTVFGRLLDGEKDETLDKLERIPTDKSTDRPLRSIRILSATVTEDPFQRFQERLDRKLKRENPSEEVLAKRRKREEDRTTWLGTELPSKNGSAAKPGTNDLMASSSSIGKYLGSKPAAKPATSSIGGNQIGAGAAADSGSKKRKTGGGGFGDFSGW